MLFELNLTQLSDFSGLFPSLSLSIYILYHSTLKASAQIILDLEMLKFSKKNAFLDNKFFCEGK
jgi:hypothetical protein